MGDPNFAGNYEQANSTKRGLGLFWAPVGGLTVDMASEEKVILMACIIPRPAWFGSGDAAQEEALEAFVSSLGRRLRRSDQSVPPWTAATYSCWFAVLEPPRCSRLVAAPGRNLPSGWKRWTRLTLNSYRQKIFDSQTGKMEEIDKKNGFQMPFWVRSE